MTAGTGRPGPRRLGVSIGKRATGTAVVALLLLAQVLAFLHFTLVDHSISPVTGRLVHRTHGHCHEPRDTGDHQPIPETPDDECQILAVLHQTATVSLPGLHVVAPAVVSDLALLPSAGDSQVQQRALFRLAPSRSPPSSG